MAIKKTFRIKKNTDFDAVFKARRSFANRAFIVYQLARTQPHYRVGLSVSKKLGNAVTRNHVKRLIRHAIRAEEGQMKPLDIVIIARKGVEAFDFAQVQKNLRHAMKGAKIYQETLK